MIELFRSAHINSSLSQEVDAEVTQILDVYDHAKGTTSRETG